MDFTTSEFSRGQEVTIKYNGKKGVVESVTPATVVVRVDRKIFYLKHGDVRV